MSRMRDEMAEQPRILAGLVGRFEADAAAIRELVPSPPQAVVLVARGSSDNAATLGRYAIEAAIGRPAALAAPSLLTRYNTMLDYPGVLVVALSQSGGTPEVVTTAERMRAAGARLIAITNNEESPLAEAADLTLGLHAGPELAVPATKTVTAQMLRVVLVAVALGSLPGVREELAELPEAVTIILADAAPAISLAARWGRATSIIAAARGVLLAAAQETALKVRETSAITATGTSSADLLHGPIASVAAGQPIMLFAGDVATDADVVELRARLEAIGADVADCSPTAAGLSLPRTSAWLAPLLATVRGQQLALELAIARGHDPDAPIGLSKVTRTH